MANVRKQAASRALAMERKREFWRLRKRGWTHERIAEHIGVDRSTVSHALKVYADKIREEILDNARYTVEEDLGLIDDLIDKASSAIHAGADIPPHMVAILRGIETRRKLLENQQKIRRALRLYDILEKRFAGANFGAMVDAAAPVLEEHAGASEPFQLTIIETSAEDLPKEPEKKVGG